MQQCPQTRLTHLKCSLTFIHCGIKSKRIAKNAKYVWPIWTFLRQRFWLQPKSLKSSYGRLKRQAMKMNSTSSDSAFWLKSRKKKRHSGKSPKLAKCQNSLSCEWGPNPYFELSFPCFNLIPANQQKGVKFKGASCWPIFPSSNQKQKCTYKSQHGGGGLINGNRCCNFNACI